jgi:SAM-dependent methyltransferase
MHFESLADEYDAARPPYPVALWDEIRRLGVLQAGHRALDVGAGSGQATGPLIAAGLEVTAVEPGTRLAGHIRDAYPAATVLGGRAEDVELSPASFDLVVVATAIHWLDVDVVLPKLRRALTSDGMLLVWRTVFGDPRAAATPFRERVQRIVAERRGSRATAWDAEDGDATARVLGSSGLFAVDSVSTFRWSTELDAPSVRRLFATFSDWSPEEVQRAAVAVEELGGTVLEHYLSWLIVLRPVPSSS